MICYGVVAILSVDLKWVLSYFNKLKRKCANNKMQLLVKSCVARTAAKPVQYTYEQNQNLGLILLLLWDLSHVIQLWGCEKPKCSVSDVLCSTCPSGSWARGRVLWLYCPLTRPLCGKAAEIWARPEDRSISAGMDETGPLLLSAGPWD